MQLQGNGLYTALLIKVLAYLLAIRSAGPLAIFFLIPLITPYHAPPESESRFERLCYCYIFTSYFQN